jgi:hypothetical protein
MGTELGCHPKRHRYLGFLVGEEEFEHGSALCRRQAEDAGGDGPVHIQRSAFLR